MEAPSEAEIEAADARNTFWHYLIRRPRNATEQAQLASHPLGESMDHQGTPSPYRQGALSAVRAPALAAAAASSRSGGASRRHADELDIWGLLGQLDDELDTGDLPEQLGEEEPAPSPLDNLWYGDLWSDRSGSHASALDRQVDRRDTPRSPFTEEHPPHHSYRHGS